VEEVLSEERESVEPDTDATDAADLMASRRIRRLAVVEDGELVGMISLGDIATKHEAGAAAYALEAVSEGVKATNAETSPKRTLSEAKRAASAPARTQEGSERKAQVVEKGPPEACAFA